MRRPIPLGAGLLVLCWLLAACGAATGPAPTLEPNPLDSAAAEATVLVQHAQATAIVLQARAQATALIEQARLAGGTPTSTVPEPVVPASPTAPPANDRAGATLAVVAAATPGEGGGDAVPETVVIPVEVTGVGFAADGGMIMVSFLAPPREADRLWPGTVSVTDEGNGAVYNEVPVLPKIGPLIGRPARAGQAGYVMLVNAPPYLQPGALVTVDLGAHQFEHVPVQ